MPKKAKLDTPAMRNQAAAKKEYDDAVSRDSKASTPATKSAMEVSRKKLHEANHAVNVERFKRVGNHRLNKALNVIKGMEAVFSPKTYAFTKEQGEIAIAEMTRAIESVREEMVKGLNPVAAPKPKGRITADLL